MMLEIVFALILAYAIGSISPSYILGKLIRGMDIREKGTRNAGAKNAFRTIGPVAGIITALFDLAKGVLAMYIAYLLNAPEIVIYLSGFAAILGHVFPFYLNFRGGTGMATAVGLLFAFIFMIKVPLVMVIITGAVALLFFLYILITKANHRFLAFVVLMAVLIMLYYFYNPTTQIIILTIFCIFLIIASIVGHVLRNKIKIQKPYRKLLRPLAIIFPVLYLLAGKFIVLIVLGVVVGFFAIAEAIKFTKPKYLSFMYRKKEKGKISSLFLFLLTSLLIIVFFAKDTAIIVLLFLIFGDLAAFSIGTAFGKVKLFNGKSLEGSIAFFLCCLFVGMVSLNFLDLSIFLIVIGAAVATVVESLPIGEDNLTVGLITALVLSALR